MKGYMRVILALVFAASSLLPFGASWAPAAQVSADEFVFSGSGVNYLGRSADLDTSSLVLDHVTNLVQNQAVTGKECASQNNRYWCEPNEEVRALADIYPVVFFAGSRPWTFCCRVSTTKFFPEDVIGDSMFVIRNGLYLSNRTQDHAKMVGVATHAYMKRDRLKIRMEAYAASFGQADHTLGNRVFGPVDTWIEKKAPHWNWVHWAISPKARVPVPTADYRFVLTPLDENDRPFLNPVTGRDFVLGTNPENAMTRCSIDPPDTPDLQWVMQNGRPEWDDISSQIPTSQPSRMSTNLTSPSDLPVP